MKPSGSPPTTLPITVIRPAAGLVALDLGEIWAYRELLYFMVWRDVKVRYKQTALGAAWAVLQPVLTMLLFSLIFGRLARIPTHGVSYPIFAFAALLPWQLFAHALTDSANSLINHQSLLTKVYFPRLLLPLSAVVAGLVDFAVAFLVLIGMMIHDRIVPGPALLLLPAFLLLALATAFAVGVWLAALNVRYRDVRYTLPFLTQVWLFATPIAYPSSLVPEAWRPLYALNPMAGVVEGFRWALLGQQEGSAPILLVSSVAVILLLATGVIYFRKTERTFADLV